VPLPVLVPELGEPPIVSPMAPWQPPSRTETHSAPTRIGHARDAVASLSAKGNRIVIQDKKNVR
jgi:hypothetical protein